MMISLSRSRLNILTNKFLRCMENWMQMSVFFVELFNELNIDQIISKYDNN